MAHKKVLLVDDETDFREICATKLKAAGFSVETAENGAEALEKLKKGVPDLMILDFMMPTMNGIETFMHVKEDENLKDLKVIFMTNHGEPLMELGEADRKYAKEMGAADFFRKTDDVDKLIDRVKKECGL